MGCYFEKQSIQHAFIQFGSYLAGPLGLEIRYWPDRSDRNMGIGQTEQTEIWVLARPNRPKYGYWPDRTDRNLGIGQTEGRSLGNGQTEQTEKWVLARPNRSKYGYWPDRNMGNGQTEQTKIAIGQTEGATQIFSRPLWTVALDPPVRDPRRSGQYLSWVADFIRGSIVILLFFCQLVISPSKLYLISALHELAMISEKMPAQHCGFCHFGKVKHRSLRFYGKRVILCEAKN